MDGSIKMFIGAGRFASNRCEQRVPHKFACATRAAANERNPPLSALIPDARGWSCLTGRREISFCTSLWNVLRYFGFDVRGINIGSSNPAHTVFMQLKYSNAVVFKFCRVCSGFRVKIFFEITGSGIDHFEQFDGKDFWNGAVAREYGDL